MMELVPYSEAARDALEKTPIKRELLYRNGDNLTVQVFWQKLGNICTLFLYDHRQNASVEFVIENDKVMERFEHPFAHPDAVLDLDRPSPPPDYYRGGDDD